MRDSYVSGVCEVCDCEIDEPMEYDEDGYYDGYVPTRCERHIDWYYDEEKKCWIDEDGIRYDKDLRCLDEEEDEE